MSPSSEQPSTVATTEGKEPWQEVLGRLEEAAGGNGAALDLARLRDLTSRELAKGPMLNVIEIVLEGVS